MTKLYHCKLCNQGGYTRKGFLNHLAQSTRHSQEEALRTHGHIVGGLVYGKGHHGT